MRRFSIHRKDIIGSTATIYGTDANHIQNVLRLSPGNAIELFDGSGIEYKAVISQMSSNKIEVTILEKTIPRTDSPMQMVIAQAFLKDRKMDRLVRQLTELGIYHFSPFIAERSIARPDMKRISKRIERWKKIAKESLKQCKRSIMPKIGPILSFEEILKLGKNYDSRIIFWENAKMPLHNTMKDNKTQENKALLILGPEGGFSDNEIEKAKAAGFVIASLGPRILKADTAPIAACTIIQYLFGDMGNKILDKVPGIH